MLRDAGGKLINLATFGATNKAEAARTDGRIAGALALGKSAITDPVGTARALGEGFTKPFTEGAAKLNAGDTFGGTAQITEAASDTILNAATGGGKAVLGVILKGGKLPKINGPDIPPPRFDEIAELFDSSNSRSGIQIGNRSVLADPTSRGGAKIFDVPGRLVKVNRPRVELKFR